MEDEVISKTQRKRESEALQDLGVELVNLSPEQVKRMALPDVIRSAVLECQRINAHGARRRQLQYLGKLMRKTESEPIALQLAEIRGESAAAKARFHALERWRDRLLREDEALSEWLDTHPGSDAQHLRTLIRNARREAEAGKPPKSSRELFRLIRTGIDAGIEPPPAPEKAVNG